MSLHRRLAYAIGYALMAAAGVCAAVWPSRSVEAASNPVNILLMVWAAFLVVGGTCAMAGAVTARWLGEYLGLPLLAAVFAVYGVSALARGQESRWTTLAGGFVFLAVAQAFMARWAEVAAVRKQADAVVRSAHG
jgi:hypothetical protein